MSTACIFKNARVEELAFDAQVVESPLRVFLGDGSLVVFPYGARVSATQVTGLGRVYDLHRNPTDTVQSVPLEGVLGMEAYDESTDVALSMFTSLLGVTASVFGASALAVAIFGSCPTVYAMGPAGEVLEAEAFSYSISPLLEGRDVDRLGAAADAEGRVELEVRNEALETHFINHLELLEVRHHPSERVLPDHDNMPALVGELRAFDRALDRSGRDVSATLAAADDQVFRTATDRVADATTADSRDWIEVVVPPVPADTVALVLRLRNSLLNTVLFYDLMLGRSGARSLDWLARDVQVIGTAVELGAWFNRTMGLRLEVEKGAEFVEVSRMGDSGPIAWKDVAFRVPVRRDGPTRIRLAFLADSWRIDRMAWSPDVSRPAVRAHPVVSLVPIGGRSSPELAARVATPDDSYLATVAGTGFTVRFETDALPAREERTFLLASQGYYTEWIRPDWIRSASSSTPFRPTDDVIPDLMDRWVDTMEHMEEAFLSSRISVR